MNEKDVEVYDREQLEALLASRGTEMRIIAIDGHPGSGKSTLASSLAESVDSGVLSSDEYVIKERDGSRYADLLNIDRLRTDFLRLRQENIVNIIEGVCVRDTLAILGACPDLAVYCKRITQAGRWADDPTLSDFPECPRDSIGWLDGAVHEYHLRERPHLQADAVVEFHADRRIDETADAEED